MGRFASDKKPGDLSIPYAWVCRNILISSVPIMHRMTTLNGGATVVTHPWFPSGTPVFSTYDHKTPTSAPSRVHLYT